MIIISVLSAFAFLFGCIIPLSINRTLDKHKQNLSGVELQGIKKLNTIPTHRYFIITLILSYVAIIPLVIHSPESLLTDGLLAVFILGPLVLGFCFRILDEKISELEILYYESSQSGDGITSDERNSAKSHGWLNSLHNTE